MVRAGLGSHPSQWESCGYHELTGACRQRRTLNTERLLWCLDMPGRGEQFRDWYARTVDDEMARSDYLARELGWGESVAVDSRDWIDGLASRIIVGRRRVEQVVSEGVTEVAEGAATYALSASRRKADTLMFGP